MLFNSGSTLICGGGVAIVGGALAGFVTSAVPFAWGTGDQLYVCGTYEANTGP